MAPSRARSTVTASSSLKLTAATVAASTEVPTAVMPCPRSRQMGRSPMASIISSAKSGREISTGRGIHGYALERHAHGGDIEGAEDRSWREIGQTRQEGCPRDGHGRPHRPRADAQESGVDRASPSARSTRCRAPAGPPSAVMRRTSSICGESDARLPGPTAARMTRSRHRGGLTRGPARRRPARGERGCGRRWRPCASANGFVVRHAVTDSADTEPSVGANDLSRDPRSGIGGQEARRPRMMAGGEGNVQRRTCLQLPLAVPAVQSRRSSACPSAVAPTQIGCKRATRCNAVDSNVRGRLVGQRRHNARAGRTWRQHRAFRLAPGRNSNWRGSR